ncbi:MAG: hypothetical protein AMJ78_09510 [Omnitrophica WOR_2 bacterium SM23_29]|nr:MAG: hypothetical protein AMJ78_09510 [Omnitrophica WOR_2 bacterium SM23_29]
MAELEYLILLNLLPDIGAVRLKNLLKRFGSVKNIFTATQSELEEVEDIGPKIASSILKCEKEKELERELKLIKKHNVKVISYLDKSYPENLKEIHNPPIILYVKGDISPEDKFAIAIVGSRNASHYGIATAERLGYELASRGLSIISGLARGIDAAGHKGALKAKGRTTAVLGSGLANIYPPEHIELADEIAKNGTIVSEFAMETAPLKENFPRRNRIISGLSLGVVVVEAARNSGALITADFALEQGRELYAVPGQARVVTSYGTNMLIRQGAKLVEMADDIIEELKDVIKGDSLFKAKSENEDERNICQSTAIRNLNESEQRILDAVKGEPTFIDDIVDASNLSTSEILNCLTKLELKGFVEQLPGKSYVRKS